MSGSGGRASRRSGRDSHTRVACTSERNPRRGAEMAAQMGKSESQRPVFGGQLTNNGRTESDSHACLSSIS